MKELNSGEKMDEKLIDFIEKLASSAPVPGGGGASALIGAIGVSLCSMVANLTSGKKKYAEFQTDIERIIVQTEKSIRDLLSLINKDAEVCEPLSRAYGIPNDTPGKDEILEAALADACSVPIEIIEQINEIIELIEELAEEGTRLAISDVGIAAAACKCALESAAMNVYINTKLMKNREYALSVNSKTTSLIETAVERCEKIYLKIVRELRCE